MVGTILEGEQGKYAISSVAGEGGVGTVYKARKTISGEVVAVKLLHSKRFPLTDVQRERFRNEISACMTVTSQYIVRGIDKGYHDDEPFLVLEWMPNGTLQQFIADGNYNSDEVVSMTAQLLKAFLDLRSFGLVHRDIKPNNVLLAANGRLKLADLGIARSFVTPAYLTASDQRLGSLLYISERQRFSPESATSRDDFYSLCLVLYELISRRRVHTRNLPLGFLRPSLAPMALSLLVDRGMEDSDAWEEVFFEMCRYIDVEREIICEDYTGSVLVPEVMLRSKAKQVMESLKDIITTETYSDSDERAPASTSLLDDSINIIRRAFDDCVREFQDSGILLRISPDVEDLGDGEYSIYFGAAFDKSVADLLDATSLRSEVEDRLFGWITLGRKDGDCYHIVGIGGKRLDVDTSVLPQNVFDTDICNLDKDEMAFLQRVGRTLALGAALGALQRIKEIIDEREVE
jgi:serine/threonine protein kinase